MDAIFYLNEKGYTKSIEITADFEVIIPERHLIVGIMLSNRFITPNQTNWFTIGDLDFDVFQVLQAEVGLILKPIEMMLLSISNLTIRINDNEFRQAYEVYKFKGFRFPR